MNASLERPTLGWARAWATARFYARPQPRRGAWYAVVAETSSDRLVLQVGPRRVAVPKHLLEFRPSRPERFTVVYLARHEVNPERESFGTRYALCPVCAGRIPLFGDPVHLHCDRCGHKGEIAWWETG